MILYTVSIHGGTDAQNAAVTAEMETTLGCASDPLDILIAEEEQGFDDDLALVVLTHRHNLNLK